MTDENEVLEPEYSSLAQDFVIGDSKYENVLEEDTHVDANDLSENYESHADRFSFYATGYELAMAHERKLKSRVERTYARVDEEARVSLKKSLSGRVTEKMVENVVITSKPYVDALEEYQEAQQNAGLWKAARDAMVHRKEMLVSLGANYRAEINSDPSLLRDQVKKVTNK